MLKTKGKKILALFLATTLLVGTNTGIVLAGQEEDLAATTASFLSSHLDVSLDTSDGKQFQTTFENYVTVDGTKLMDGENELRFVSLNFPQALSSTPWEQANAVKTIKAMGGNVTRSYTIPVANGNNASTAYVTGVDAEGNLTFNEDALVGLDSMLNICNKEGIRLIVPFVDHWHWIGGMDGYCKLAGITISTTSSLDPNAWQFYTDETAKGLFKQMITHLMDRTNSITGIKYKDDPSVICWETGNELAAYDSTSAPKFPQAWTTEMAAHVKSLGVNQLLLDGKMDATSESLKDPNIDILGSHYYTGSYPAKLRNDTELSFNNGTNPVLDTNDDPLPGKPFILGEFGAYTSSEQVENVFDVGVELGTNGMMMWSLRGHKDGFGYYFHPEDPGNWAAYHWPGFPTGDYYDETDIVRTIFAYGQLVNGNAVDIAAAKQIAIPAPETAEAPLLYPISTVGDIQWRGVVGGAWYEIQRADGSAPVEEDWVTIADESDYVYDSGRNWENNAIACIAGYHDETAVTGETYSYRLKACNESGTGLWSNVVTTVEAEHIIVDNLDMISVSSTDQNPTEIRNTYSTDHSANVTVSGGVLQNTSTQEGYITYSSKIPMTSIEITTKNTPEVAPKVFVSRDDIVYTEVAVTGSGVTYTVDLLPVGTYFTRVYVAANNGTMLDSIKTVYTYTGDESEIHEIKDYPANVLIQDETFDSGNAKYASKSTNLEVITDGQVSGLATNDANAGSLIYKAGADMTSFRVIAYGKNSAIPVVESSMDGVNFNAVVAQAETETVGVYTKHIFANVDVTTSVRFVRITYPAGQGDVVVKSVEVASGTKRLPMRDQAPTNVLEDGEYYFGTDAKLLEAYVSSNGEMSKVLGAEDFSEFDVLFAWIKGDNSGNNIVFSITDRNDVVWNSTKALNGTTGTMAKFEFKDFTTITPDAVQDFSEVKAFKVGIEGATSITPSLDEVNFYTGNYGLKLDYTKGENSTISLDNVYVSSLTKVDDYEGFNGANSLLQAAYARNTGGGTLNFTLDPEHKSEGAYGMSFAYNYTGKGYAGATKSMDYLNLTDYDGFKIWYMGDGSGNSLTFQVKTANGLSWEAIGYMAGTGATELYMPFDSFVAPSWDPREGTLDNTQNIIQFSIYTNKVGSGSETGTIYFDDIKGANFVTELATADVAITTPTDQVISAFPATISGTANYVKYITLQIGTKVKNVPVADDGTWSYAITDADDIYNAEAIPVTASILYHNYNVAPIKTDGIDITIDVEGNIEQVEVVYPNLAINGDFSGGFTDWITSGFAVSDGVASKIENNGFVCWSNEAYAGTLTQTLTVPNGIYTLKAKMKVKSGFNDARMKLTSGEQVAESAFIDTQDADKTVALGKTIEVRNNQISIVFTADSPAGGLVFSVDDVELNKVGEINLMTNGDFTAVATDWPNLPTGWDAVYTGGDGWSPIKGDSGTFVGYADAAYTFSLSQSISGIEPGIYALTADAVLNDGVVNGVKFAAKNGETTLLEADQLSYLTLGNPGKLEGITITEGTVTIVISGDIGSKGLALDNVVLVRTGDLPPHNYITNSDFTAVNGTWPNIPTGWDTTYVGGDGWSPIKGDSGAFVGYASAPYTFALSQNVSGLNEGYYQLSSSIKLNDGTVNDVKIKVMAGSEILSERSVLSELLANTAVAVDLLNIPVRAEDITVTISGDIGSKGLTIDDVTLIRTGNVPPINYIANSSFEANAAAVAGPAILNWVATDSWGTGTLSKTETGGHDGDYALSRWYSDPYSATNAQTLTDLPDGIYSLKAWAMSKAAEEGKPYLITNISIKVGNAQSQTVQVAANGAWNQYAIENVTIHNGDEVVVSIITEDTVGGGWSKIDSVELNRVSDLTPPNTYAVSVGTLVGGSIITNLATAAEGATISLTVTPDNGKQLKAGTLKYNDGSNHSITGTSFTMPAGNVTVTAEFEAIPSNSGSTQVDTPVVQVPKDIITDSPATGSDAPSVTATMITEAISTSTGNATATVTESRVNEIINLAIAQAAEKGVDTTANVEIKINAPVNSKSVELTIPQKSVSAVVSSSTEALTVSSPIADITFGDKALASISQAATGDIKISASKVDVTTLSQETQLAVSERPVYNFSVKSGDQTISQFGGEVTVSVPYTLLAGEDASAIVIYYVNAKGELEIVSNCSYDLVTGMVNFSTNHFSQYVIGYNKVSFNDVVVSAWYSKAVEFIAARGITTGTGNGNFSPEAKLSRGQFLVMVMRTYGITPDQDATNNFVDAGDMYYTDYLATAMRLGLSNGIGNNMFAPEKDITRQEMFTLLYNTLKVMNKIPVTSTGKALKDFSDDDQIAPWAKDAMELFVTSGTISGVEGKILPKDTAYRAQMAQVLYNLLAK